MAVLTVPALAGVESLYGSPDLSAVVSGTNEFAPGDEVTLQVIVSNTGLNTVIQVTSSTISPPDAPNLAKLVQAGLSAGGAPVTIKSEPQQIGDIA
ncbi:MAG: S-layer protein, partial [Methanofollis liminatans]|nr:S-layer protein [Methanofollis liminatans]